MIILISLMNAERIEYKKYFPFSMSINYPHNIKVILSLTLKSANIEINDIVSFFYILLFQILGGVP